MRNYKFTRDTTTILLPAYNLSAAYGQLRNIYGSSNDWVWKGTEPLKI